MNYNLILICGIGRCGSGFTNLLFALHPDITMRSGPGMGGLAKMCDAGRRDIPVTELYDMWLQEEYGSWKEFDHDGNRQPGYEKYYSYLKEKHEKRYCLGIWHNRGIMYYRPMLQHIDAKCLILYCVRPIIEHFRSFKQWFWKDGCTPERFMSYLRDTLKEVDAVNEMKTDKVFFRRVNIFQDNTTVINEFEQIFDEILWIKMSDLQKEYLLENRQIGKSRLGADYSDDELLAELSLVPDFKIISERYKKLL